MYRQLESIAELIRENSDFIIIAHISPDGDTLGSSLALKCVMQRMNKRCSVVCDNRVPKVYAFLPYADGVLATADAHPAECCIAVDCADTGRLGTAVELFEGAKRTAVIDHHPTNAGYAQLNAVDGDAAAAGELMYELCLLLTGVLHEDTATCLYTALMTDTGSFAYGNTRPRTHEIAARLLEAGVDHYDINRKVYRTLPFSRVKLLGVAINNMRLHEGGRVCISALTAEELRLVGAADEDTEGVIDHLRDVSTVEVAVLIRESAQDTYKVSLRSKLCADVSAISHRMGGGGHKHAAGYTAHGTLDDVYFTALSLAAQALEEN